MIDRYTPDFEIMELWRDLVPRKKLPFHTRLESLSMQGYALDDQKKCGVYGALQGEQVLAVPLRKKKKIWLCRAEQIQSPSSDRVEPGCQYANICGGCSWQHLSRQGQLNLKEAWLRELFADITPRQWLKPLIGEGAGYRSKARLGVRFVAKKEKTLVGFREKANSFIADVSRCDILAPPLDNLLEPLSELIDLFAEPALIPQIEVAAGDEGAALVVRHLAKLSEKDLLALTEFADRHQVLIFLQPGGSDSVALFAPQGAEALLSYSLKDQHLKFLFHPLDFTQVNQSVNQLMVNQALDLLDLHGKDRVLDGFCGIGNFSLPMAQEAAFVTGLEGSESAVSRAQNNASLNDVNNIEFKYCDLYGTQLPQIGDGSYNKALMDPPRSGAEGFCKVLAASEVERVVYVSCNPKTLVRDAEILISGGFDFNNMGMIDMFPHTTHLETITLFTR